MDQKLKIPNYDTLNRSLSPSRFLGETCHQHYFKKPKCFSPVVSCKPDDRIPRTEFNC